MSGSGQAVFLSYASQDAAAVERIATALRASGVEVWFDKNELVGGDAWDAKIRRQIAECALFVPVISAATQARREGYFRLEWRLAAQRTHMMSEQVAFLLPVFVDDTRDAAADVPAEFKSVQWTRLPGGETPEKFCTRVRQLLGGDVVGPVVSRAPDHRSGLERRSRGSRRWLAPAVLAFMALVALAIWRPWKKPAPAPVPTAPASLSEAAQLVAKARSLIDQINVYRPNYETASSLLEQATKLDPNDAVAWAMWSKLDSSYIQWGLDFTTDRKNEARRKAARAMSLAPQSREACLAQANALVHVVATAAARSEAEPQLQSLAREYPNDGEIMCALGECLHASDPAASTAWFERASRQPGFELRGAEGLAWHHYLGGRYPEADQALDNLLARERTWKGLRWKASVAAEWHGDFETSRRLLGELPPSQMLEDFCVGTALNLYRYARDLGRMEKLLKDFPRDFIYANPLSGPKGLLLGDVLAQANRDDAARFEWNLALPLVDKQLAGNPSDQRLMAWRIALLARLGRLEEARAGWNLLAQRTGQTEVPFGGVEAMCLLGFDEIALRATEKQFEKPGRTVTAAVLGHDSIYDRLRAKPRFQALLARVEADPRFTPTPKPSPATVGDKSVAVLAFDNRSDDKEAEYFSDGVSEELINALGRVPGLTVKGRTSAFFFKGKNATAQEIAEKLGVNYLVRGSVRKAGGKVRITAQLSRAATDEIVWSSEPLEREAKDVFAVQDEIAALIAKNLSLKLGGAGRAAKPIDPEAYRLYLEGRHFWSLRSFGGFDRAEIALKQAVALEPDSALIRAGLAELYATRGWYRSQNTQDPGDSYALAAAEAERAAALDPANAQAIVARATIAIAQRQFNEAGRLLRQALTLAPNDASAFDRLGDLMVRTGRLDAAVENYQRGMQLDPLSVYLVRDVVRQLAYARRFQEVIDTLDRFEAASPRDWRTIVWRAQSLIHFGKTDQAASELRAVLPNITPDEFSSSGASIAELVYSLRLAKCDVESEALAQRLLERHHPGTYLHAMVLAARGRTEAALPLLVTFPVGSEDRLFWGAVFDPMRDDPRFLRKVDEFGVAAEYKVARETLARMLNEQAVKE